MKTILRVAIALIILACGLGYSDPGTWDGSHKPINHIEMMLHNDANRPASNISINSIANAAVDQTGFKKTTNCIANCNIAQAIGATK